VALPNEPLDDDSLDAEIDAMFKGRKFATLDETWDALRIKKSYGFQLINRGILERIKIGRRSMITVRSIKKLVKTGVPKLVRRPKTSAKAAAADRPGGEPPHDQAQQEPQVHDENGEQDTGPETSPETSPAPAQGSPETSPG
jgi:hypothetical protein